MQTTLSESKQKVYNFRHTYVEPAMYLQPTKNKNKVLTMELLFSGKLKTESISKIQE